MSAALVTSENPDSDFVLRGQSPYYIERTSFYPTKSDITSTTRNLSQHAYRADAYKDVLEDDQTLHSTLRSVSRSLRQVSNNIAKSLLEESTAKGNYSKVQANGLTKDVPVYDREWLSGVNWQTSSGRQVSFTQSFPPTTWHHPNRSHSSLDFVNEMQDNQREAEELRRIVNTEMHLADVPATRFTRKDLLAAEYFPVTMSESDFDVSSTRRSRSRTRKSNQVKASPLLKAPITDNYQAMKHLEKLYFVASEAPGTAAATIAIMSPYQEEMGRLRLERLRLEEEHLKELRRLSELERSRGPKPKWYELKGPQFHFEAQKNNDILRSQERWKDIARKEDVLARTSQEFQRSLMRAVSF